MWVAFSGHTVLSQGMAHGEKNQLPAGSSRRRFNPETACRNAVVAQWPAPAVAGDERHLWWCAVDMMIHSIAMQSSLACVQAFLAIGAVIAVC